MEGQNSILARLVSIEQTLHAVQAKQTEFAEGLDTMAERASEQETRMCAL